MTRCGYHIRVEFSQSQNRAAYFEDLAESKKISGSASTAHRTDVYLCDANDTSRLVLLVVNSLVISRLSTAVSEADYLARDMIRPFEILCDFCGHRANVSWRLRQQCPEINRLRLSRPKVNRYCVNPVTSEIVDRYVCNTGDSSGFQSNVRF